jgi:hypothetical protein
LNCSTKSSDGSSPTKQFQPKETIIYIRLVRWAMEALDVYTLNTSPTPPPRAQPQQALLHGILILFSLSGYLSSVWIQVQIQSKLLITKTENNYR